MIKLFLTLICVYANAEPLGTYKIKAIVRSVEKDTVGIVWHNQVVKLPRTSVDGSVKVDEKTPQTVVLSEADFNRIQTAWYQNQARKPASK